MDSAVFSVFPPPLHNDLGDFAPCRSFSREQTSSHSENNKKEVTQSPLFYTVSFNNFFLMNEVTDRLCLLSVHSLGREGRDHCNHQAELRLLRVGRGLLPPRDVPGSHSGGETTNAAQSRTTGQPGASRLLNPLMNCLTSVLELVQRLLSKRWVAFTALQNMNISDFFPAERMDGPEGRGFLAKYCPEAYKAA